jgi:hypothetical protein
MWDRIRANLKVFGIAVVFGLGAYTVIMVLHAIGRMFGARL